MDLPDMPTHPSRSTQFTLVVCAVLALALAGCSSTATHSDADLVPLDRLPRSTLSESSGPTKSPTPPDSPVASEAPADTDGAPEDVLCWPHWSRSVRTPGGEEPEYRWIFPDLEDLFSEGEADLPGLRLYLESPNRTIAANAAVMVLRMGDTSLVARVGEAAGNTKLHVRLRCAASDTLGHVPNGTALLQGLVDQEVARADESKGRHSPAVHGELVRALGRQVRPTDEPRLTEALTAKSDDVKLAALDVWKQSPGGPFPESGLALRNHRDPRIRAHLMAALVQHPSEETLDYLVSALSDPDLKVRTAAIGAMGTLGDEQAVASLEPLLEDGVEAERIAAVRALADLGNMESVKAGANDKAWRVRLAVAEVLPRLPGDPDVTLAVKLLEDPSAEVQHQAVAAIATWPPGIAERLLLDVLGKCPCRSQQLAVDSLAATWPEGGPLLKKFPVGQAPAARHVALAEIRRAYGERNVAVSKRTSKTDTAKMTFSQEQLAAVVGSVRTLQSSGTGTPEALDAIARLRGVGAGWIDVVEYLVEQRGIVLPECIFEDVLAADQPGFASVERLRREDVQVRRRVARELSEHFAHRRPRPLLLHRLADLAVMETDAVVWQYLLAAVRDLEDEQTFRLVYVAAGHASAGIRQAACEHLGRHPRPEHASVLAGTLGDASVPVLCAAVTALGSCGKDVDDGPIVQLLGVQSESVQIAAAVTLTRLDRPEGPAALERLSYSISNETRLVVARAMGELGLPEFAPTLIRMLDDRHGIRVAAQRSLAEVAECEEAEVPGLLESERIEAWRKWAAQGGKSEMRISKSETNSKF